MRTRSIQVGATYIVCVPQRIPAGIKGRVPHSREQLAADLRLHLSRGRRFDLTVTGVHVPARTVDGFETTTTGTTALRLTVGQAETLGLPEGTYTIEGLVRDGEGRPVELPVTVPHIGLPARWLAPLGTQTALGDVAIAHYRHGVRLDATGLDSSLIAQKAGEMLENQRQLAARALDDYTAEEYLRIVEVQCAEWRRIGLVMSGTGAARYRPQDDPDLGASDLIDPYGREET